MELLQKLLKDSFFRPYNEYYLVALLANMTSPPGSKANLHFETYYSTEGEPQGDCCHPVTKNYQGYDLLTDNPAIFMSSFIPQFNSYLSKGGSPVQIPVLTPVYIGYQDNQFRVPQHSCRSSCFCKDEAVLSCEFWFIFRNVALI